MPAIIEFSYNQGNFASNIYKEGNFASLIYRNKITFLKSECAWFEICYRGNIVSIEYYQVNFLKLTNYS